MDNRKPTDQDIAATQERLDAFTEALARGRIYRFDQLKPPPRLVCAERAANPPNGEQGE